MSKGGRGVLAEGIWFNTAAAAVDFRVLTTFLVLRREAPGLNATFRLERLQPELDRHQSLGNDQPSDEDPTKFRDQIKFRSKQFQKLHSFQKVKEDFNFQRRSARSKNWLTRI
ncbi:hypothetical protein HanPI659440_Chr10g0372911 [Helianthus annuus]|nr:hypothetical protein HanPI659440_Chr10g0372911 [Helianthus annuus]